MRRRWTETADVQTSEIAMQSLQDEIKFAKKEIDAHNFDMLRPSIEEEMDRDC